MTLSLTPRDNAVPGTNYRITAYITKPEGFWRHRYHQLYLNGRSLVDSQEATSDYDDVSSVSVVSAFTAGGTGTLAIDYVAQEERDILIILADANSNYSWTAWVRYPVAAGEYREVTNGRTNGDTYEWLRMVTPIQCKSNDSGSIKSELRYDAYGNVTSDTRQNGYTSGGRTLRYSTFDKPLAITKVSHTVRCPSRARYLRIDDGPAASTDRITRYLGSV